MRQPSSPSGHAIASNLPGGSAVAASSAWSSPRLSVSWNELARAFLAQAPWILTVIASVWAGTLYVWQRGLYWDDYAFAAAPLRDEWPLRLEPRALSRILQIGLGDLVPGMELLARLIVALTVGSAVVLLATLVLRTLGDRLTAVLAAWFFSSALLGFEATLWLSANGFVFGTVFALLAAHACLSCLGGSWLRNGVWLALGALSFAVALLFFEVYASMAAIVPLLVVLAAARRGFPAPAAALRGALSCVSLAAPAGLVYVGLYRGSALLKQRGLDLNPARIAAHFSAFWDGLLRSSLFPSGGDAPPVNAVNAGMAGLFGSVAGMALIALLLAVVTLTLIAWRPDEVSMPGWRTLAAFGALGLVFAASTYFLPGVLTRGQAVASRLMYLPWAGMSMAFAAVLAAFARSMPRFVGDRIALALAGTFLIVSTIGMVGQATAYQARWRLDQRQLTALRTAFVPEDIPSGANLLPIDVDERLPGPSGRLSDSLLGVFETQVATGAVQRSLGRRDVRFQSLNRWQRGMIAAGQTTSGLPSTAQGARSLVPFTYRDGKVVAIELITVRARGKTTSVKFPFVQVLARRGAETQAELVIGPRR